MSGERIPPREAAAAAAADGDIHIDLRSKHSQVRLEEARGSVDLFIIFRPAL